jgi:hypothetical protein
MKRVQERIGLGEITLADERKASEKVPEQLDESLAFGTVLGAPAWQKPVHDPSRPTAAALAPAGPAIGVALAERPPSGGGDVDSDDSSQGEVNDGVDETADEEPAADEPTDEVETATAEEEPAEVEAPSEEVTDSDDATSDERPADEEEPAAAKTPKRVRTRKRNAAEGSAEE